MKITIASVVLTAAALPIFAATPYQLPGMVICDKASCDIFLDKNGFIARTDSGKRIFSFPVEQTIFDSYTLFRIRGDYILEKDNSTSSKNWSTMTFSYKDGIVLANRYLSLARSFSPKTIQWSGMECRGNTVLSSKKSPFNSANSALCGYNAKPQYFKLRETDAIQAARKKGLVVEVPVFNSAHSIKKSSVYLFMGSREPDAGAILCLSGCSKNKEMKRN
jgi:hypothetical protein